MHLSIITPEKTLFDAQAQSVTAPGSDGEFGVLDGHMPFVTTLREGTVQVEVNANDVVTFQVAGGVAEVTPEKCVLLVEMAA